MKSKFPKFHHAYPQTFNRAIELRGTQTTAEKRLWEMLRNRQIQNAKFRRQHPVGPFITDFYCHEYLLVVELDGNIHELADVRENDRARQEYIESLGLTVLRFTNDDVFEIPEQIIEKIKEYIDRSKVIK